MRKISLTGGPVYLLTFAASILQLKLFASVIDARQQTAVVARRTRLPR